MASVSMNLTLLILKVILKQKRWDLHNQDTPNGKKKTEKIITIAATCDVAVCVWVDCIIEICQAVFRVKPW